MRKEINTPNEPRYWIYGKPYGDIGGEKAMEIWNKESRKRERKERVFKTLWSPVGKLRKLINIKFERR